MRTIAVDWSGRKTGAARHIWAAEVVGGELVHLASGLRGPELVSWLCRRKAETPDLAVGLDFAFSLPAWYMNEKGFASAMEVWEAAEQEGEAWLASCAPPFWGRPGAKKPQGQVHFRMTEQEVLPTGPNRILPKSAFQIGGAGAVGTGSIRGMTLLSHLRRQGFCIWPFDSPVKAPVALEIYPRLLTGPVNKSSPEGRAAFLQALSWPADPVQRARMEESDDAFDAALSARQMDRHLGDCAGLPDDLPEAARLEGWIWSPEPGA